MACRNQFQFQFYKQYIINHYIFSKRIQNKKENYNRNVIRRKVIISEYRNCVQIHNENKLHSEYNQQVAIEKKKTNEMLNILCM